MGGTPQTINEKENDGSPLTVGQKSKIIPDHFPLIYNHDTMNYETLEPTHIDLMPLRLRARGSDHGLFRSRLFNH